MSGLDSKPTVEVLLGTYNGEKYLTEFLDSLVNQEFVSINLIVSDDGSVDQTLKILDTYKDKFSGFRLVEGPKKGAALNYLSLLRLSQCEYVAFADQDDIWHSDHLINSVNRLRFHPNTPALSYSAMLEKYENNRKLERAWPNSNQIFDLSSILVQNYARGCTIAMNKKAAELINSRFPKFVSMHDWWVLQVVLVHGKVVFSEKPELIYRVHSSNDTGIPTRSKGYLTFLKQLVVGKWAPMGQAIELMGLFGDSMDATSRVILSDFILLKNFSFKMLLKVWKRKYFSKEHLLEEAGLRFVVFLIPIASRNWK